MATRQNAPETIREEGVNVHLAQLLRNRGISARAERRSREGIPDIRADLRSGDLVILECKWEDTASLLENQLDERLDAFPEALGMVGVLYPVQSHCLNKNVTEGKQFSQPISNCAGSHVRGLAVVVGVVCRQSFRASAPALALGKPVQSRPGTIPSAASPFLTAPVRRTTQSPRRSASVWDPRVSRCNLP